MYTIDSERLAQITLSWGPHASRDSGMCMLEAAAYLAGEEHSDHPQCVSPILGRVGRTVNDVTPDFSRQDLVRLIPSMLGTRWDGLDYIRFRMVRSRCAEKHLGEWLPRFPDSERFLERLDEVVDGRESEALDDLIEDVRAAYLPEGWREKDPIPDYRRFRLESCLAGLAENIISFTAQFSEADLPMVFYDETKHNECVSFLADLITAAH